MKKHTIISHFFIMYLLTVTLCLSAQTSENSEFAVIFKLDKHLTHTDTTNQIRGTILFINITHQTIEISPHIRHGWDGNDPFTIQAFDFNDKVIDISCDCDYDFVMPMDFMKFNKCDTIKEMINSNLYRFKNKGKFKLRVLFNPENLFHVLSKEIIITRTGIEAVEACRSDPTIDLVLMDIQMPLMDGYEATAQIRQFNTQLVIIAQTAFALFGEKEKAIKAGCNDYISKPIRKDELLAIIKKYFNN